MFNLFQKQNTRGYSGVESYKFIDELLNDSGKSLKVISPYIGISYARKLLKLAERKKIYLLTSGGERKKDEDAVKLLIKGSRKLNAKLLLLLLIVGGTLFYAKLYLYGAFISVIIVAVLYFGLINKPKSTRNLHVKIATNKFIHEKMYLSERKAIVGSANMTYKGTHSNIEHIEIIEDLERINELDSHFDALWSKY